MLGKIFKYGFFLRLYFLFKGRFSNWLIYLFLSITIFYAHNEIKDISIAITNDRLLVWSYIIKNILLLLLVIIFLVKEVKIFRKNNTIIKNQNNHSEKKEKKPIEGDGFNAIRAKKKLNSNAENILNNKRENYK